MATIVRKPILRRLVPFFLCVCLLVCMVGQTRSEAAAGAIVAGGAVVLGAILLACGVKFLDLDGLNEAISQLYDWLLEQTMFDEAIQILHVLAQQVSDAAIAGIVKHWEIARQLWDAVVYWIKLEFGVNPPASGYLIEIGREWNGDFTIPQLNVLPAEMKIPGVNIMNILDYTVNVMDGLSVRYQWNRAMNHYTAINFTIGGFKLELIKPYNSLFAADTAFTSGMGDNYFRFDSQFMETEAGYYFMFYSSFLYVWATEKLNYPFYGTTNIGSLHPPQPLESARITTPSGNTREINLSDFTYADTGESVIPGVNWGSLESLYSGNDLINRKIGHLIGYLYYGVPELSAEWNIDVDYYPDIGVFNPGNDKTKDPVITIPSSITDMVRADPTTVTQVATGNPVPDAGDANRFRAPSIMLQKFPFCIPWDIYMAFSMLAAEPETPSFEIPIKFSRLGIDETIVIDLEQFETVAKVTRWFLSAAFMVGLILITRKIVKG